MDYSRFRVQHPLLDQLRCLDAEASRLFLSDSDSGFGCLGLILDKSLDESRYGHCTPANCVTFAHTGGEGVHFSFLLDDGAVNERCPVVVTCPCLSGGTYVVGEGLHEFLCLGHYRGYFGLEQLAFYPELTMEVFTNPNWRPTEQWHYSAGFALGQSYRTDFLGVNASTTDIAIRALRFLIDRLGLRPWKDSARFKDLQDAYQQILLPPLEEIG